MCIALCTIVAHNIAQNRPDNFPSYPPDNHHCSDYVYLREGGDENGRMCKVKVKDRVPGKELRERLGIDDVILILQQIRFQWYGHVL